MRRLRYRLYDVYQQLVREGAFEAKLREMYDWGKRFGWEPVVWKDGQPHPAPQPAPAAVAAAYASGAAAAAGGLAHQMHGARPGHLHHQHQHQQHRGMHGMGGLRGQGKR